MNYKNRFTGEIISADCYNKLSFLSKMKFHMFDCGAPTHQVTNAEEDHDDGDGHNTSGGFLLSMIVAEETGSTLAGAAIGGDLLGAVVGSELSDANNVSNDVTFGGGDFSGGGATEDYSKSDDTVVADDPVDTTSNDNSFDSGSSDFSSGGSDF